MASDFQWHDKISLLACSFVFICKCGSSIQPYTDMHNDRESCKYSGVQGLFFSKKLRMKKPGMPEAKELWSHSRWWKFKYSLQPLLFFSD